MRQKVSDYIADFLVNNRISDVFTVTGGGAMHLNDSFGHHPKLRCTYNHHEQASAIAAEAYARVHNKIAVVCVTTGPGATNALTGVSGGWMDSIPMLVFSGQARYATTVQASGLPLRTRGVQEFDIIPCVANMTKYCHMITDPLDIRFCLEKALYMAREGRPGPSWLDIPLDIQGAVIETEELKGFTPPEENHAPSQGVVETIVSKLQTAQRPVLFVGNGVRLSGAHGQFLQLADKLGIPVVTGMSSVDAIHSDHPLYIGRSGGTGDRAGNFTIQNCDLLLSLGSRLSYFQTGFNYQTWARAAYKIVNDIDSAELDKDSIKADLKVCCDIAQLIDALNEALASPLPPKTAWLDTCRNWKKAYPVVLPKHYADPKPNIYAFYQELTKRLNGEDKLVVSVGTSRVAGSQSSIIHKGMRFITNPSTAAMGYCLPAAIGVSIAEAGKRTVLVTGDGSFQMNIQELQTIVHNKLPIIMFVMNNQGYHSIRMTQNNYFGKPLVGVGPESGDLSFPDLEKIAYAYGIPFIRCEQTDCMTDCIEKALAQSGPVLCEMMLSTQQITEPKAASKKLDNGKMVSAPLEDMSPFLPREELKNNMLIPLVDFE